STRRATPSRDSNSTDPTSSGQSAGLSGSAPASHSGCGAVQRQSPEAISLASTGRDSMVRPERRRREMVEEAPLEETASGLAPAGPGWFVVNVEDTAWMTSG